MWPWQTSSPSAVLGLYPSMVDMCRATYTTVSTSIDDELRADPRAGKDALKPNTKALILCNPSNPTGCLWMRQQRGLLKVLDDHERKTGKRSGSSPTRSRAAKLRDTPRAVALGPRPGRAP